MSNKSIIQQLAEKIASDVFEVGSELGQPCNRIAYMTGKWGVDEKQMGGSNIHSLTNIIAGSLLKNLTGDLSNGNENTRTDM